MKTEDMTVIMNIQAMSKVIKKEIPFEKLETMTSDDLHKLQEDLIMMYNEAIKE